MARGIDTQRTADSLEGLSKHFERVSKNLENLSRIFRNAKQGDSGAAVLLREILEAFRMHQSDMNEYIQHLQAQLRSVEQSDV